MKHPATIGIAVLASTLAIAGAHAARPDFVKQAGKARFIHGDDLVTDVLPETGTSISARLQTPREKAAGLSTVMVTASGDVYESRVAPEDVAVFERALREIEREGRPMAHPEVPGVLPADHPLSRGTQPAPTVVIGADNRTKVTNTVAAPYWNIGRIAIGCTGTLITPKHVLTAGHCVSDGAGSFYSNLAFSVAQNGSYRPWGTTAWSRALTTSAWHNNANSNYDYALIVLSAAPHGGNAGWGVYAGNGSYSITGYPADKPAGTMWRHAGAVSTSGSYRLCYTIDTAGGNSGSGIADGSAYVRGIHTTGSSSQNCGTRLTSTVYNTLQGWISQYP